MVQKVGDGELIGGDHGIAEPRLSEVIEIFHRHFASSKQLRGVSHESLEDITDEAGHQLLSVGEIQIITREANTVGKGLFYLSSATASSIA